MMLINPFNVSPSSTATTILMPFTVTSGLADVVSGHATTSTGSPTISMTQSRWGNGALYIDAGTSLKINSTSTLNLDGLVPFTFEFWVYNTRNTINASFISMRDAPVICPLVVMKGWTFKGNSVLTSFTILTPSTTVPLNQWAHIAIVGDGTNIKEYVDGVLAITTAHPNWSAGNNLLNIGQDPEDSFVGYMNDLRFSNTAIYTSNFTPPTSPF